MKKIISIDPSSQRCGWAIFDIDTERIVSGNIVLINKYEKNERQWALKQCLIKIFKEQEVDINEDFFVIEQPWVNIKLICNQRGGTNFTDILRLSEFVGVCKSFAKNYKMVYPNQWYLHFFPQDRYVKRLVRKEKSKEFFFPYINKKRYSHDEADAVGILLWYLEKHYE